MMMIHELYQHVPTSVKYLIFAFGANVANPIRHELMTLFAVEHHCMEWHQRYHECFCTFTTCFCAQRMTFSPIRILHRLQQERQLQDLIGSGAGYY